MRILKNRSPLCVDIAMRIRRSMIYVDIAMRTLTDYRLCHIRKYCWQPQSFNPGSNHQWVSSKGAYSRAPFGGNSLLETGNIKR
jgi:hypothetical protein